MTDTVDGAALARFHHDHDAPDDGVRLAAYAESPRAGDWTLRSALVRYAQPEPTRASAVLELVRRTDGALKPFARLLDATASATDPGLSAGSFARGQFSPSSAVRVDARSTDLARLAVAAPGHLDAVIDQYESVQVLEPEERSVVPLLAVAVELDRLGDVLAAWAIDRTRPRPDDEVDAIARRSFAMLGALGVEREARPPRRT